MTVEWFTSENGLQGLREPPVANTPDMELYLSNNYANYPPQVPDPMFPNQDSGQNNFLQYLMSGGGGGGEMPTNTTPSDIVSLNSPNMPSPSTVSHNSPRTTPLQGGAPIRKTPEEVNECRWVDQITRQPCGIKFNDVSALGQHINSHHVKETPFLCWWENCKNANHPFSRKYKLIYHIRTHTKEKPHKCKECLKQFTRLESYNSHRKTHMKQNTSNPPSPANGIQGGMTSSVLHSMHQQQPQQQQQQQPQMNVIMSSSVVPGGQMLQNGQLMGPITIMTQPNNFANKSPPTSHQTSPCATSSSLPPGCVAMATPGSVVMTTQGTGTVMSTQGSGCTMVPPSSSESAPIKLEASSQDEGMVNKVTGGGGGAPPIFTQSQYQYPPGHAMSRPPSVTPCDSLPPQHQAPNMTVNQGAHMGAMSAHMMHGSPRFNQHMLRHKMPMHQQPGYMMPQGGGGGPMNMVMTPAMQGQPMKPFNQVQASQSKPKSSPQMRNGKSHSQPNSPANNSMSPVIKTPPGAAGGVKTSASPSNLLGSPKMNVSRPPGPQHPAQPLPMSEMNSSLVTAASSVVTTPSNPLTHNQMQHHSEQHLSHNQISHQASQQMSSPQISNPSPQQMTHQQNNQISHPSIQVSHPTNQMSAHPSSQMSHPTNQLSHPTLQHPAMTGSEPRMMGMRPHMGGGHPGVPPPGHMMPGMMGGQAPPPMYMNMMANRPPAPTPASRTTSQPKGKNNVSVICPICNKIYTNRKALRKHIKGTTCGKSVTDIDKAMEEALEGPTEPGPDPRLAGNAANMAPYQNQYNVMQGGYNDQFKRMRYDQSYQEQVARQQFYLVPMQQQQQQQQRPPVYPSPQPNLMMPHMGPPAHMGGGAMSPHMPTSTQGGGMIMSQSGPLYPPDSDALVKSTSSPALRSPGMMCPSDTSPISPIKRNSEPNFTALLTDPSMDNLFDWSWDPNNISTT